MILLIHIFTIIILFKLKIENKNLKIIQKNFYNNNPNMESLIKNFYYYPLQGTGFWNKAAYKFILVFNNCCLIRYVKNSLINQYLINSRDIKAYREIYLDNN